MQRRRRGKEEGHKRYFKVRADSSRIYLIVFNCLIVVTTHYILSRGGKTRTDRSSNSNSHNNGSKRVQK